MSYPDTNLDEKNYGNTLANGQSLPKKVSTLMYKNEKINIMVKHSTLIIRILEKLRRI